MPLSFLQHHAQLLVDFWRLSQKARTVQGWLHDVEGYCLLELAEQGPGFGAVVEIGSYMGRSTFWLASGVARANRGKVTAIDHFEGSTEHQKEGFIPSETVVTQGSTLKIFRENLHRLEIAQVVDTLCMASQKAAREWTDPVRLLFIDGEHSYEAVRDDFEAWSPFVVPSGVIAFHDFGNPHFPGVKKFCSGLITGQEYRLLCLVRHLLIVQKAGAVKSS